MKKNHFLYLLFMGFNLFTVQKKILCQNAHDFAKMTEVLAPPPNAAALGKYGGIDISLNTGMVSKTISLYNFKSSQLEVPISLAYSSGGFRISEAPSRTGVGWTLNIGGVITKTVIGLDDAGRTRVLPPSTIQQNAASYDFLYKAGEEGGYDAEPDQYNFNFNGYSGKFVYDENNQVTFLPANNLKVERNTGGYDFKITTPDGVIYYFGGSGATEQNKKTSSCGKGFDIWVPTAFYLSKIVSPLGQEINFSYESVFYDYLGTVDESMYLDGITNAGSPLCLDGSGGCPVYSSQSRTCQYTYTVQGVVLKQISSSQIGSVNIEYTYQGSSLDSLFSKITVKDLNSATKKIFEFSYNRIQSTLFTNQFQNTTNRDFLEKVSEKSINGSESKDYKLSYNNINELPVFNSFAVDPWGFFNGKTNYDLIQKPFDFYTQSQFPNATADRSPDYHYALKGLLSKIEYPTKGYDTIIYEGNDCHGFTLVPPALTEVTKSVTGTGFMTQVSSSSSSLSISYAQDAKLEYIIIDNSGNGSFDPLHNKGTIILTDLTTSQDIFTKVAIPDNILHAEVVFPAVGHSYQITVIANGSVVTTNAILHYRPGSPTSTNNIVLGGVRVKTASSYSNAGAVAATKNYYYVFLDSLNTSSGGYQSEPYYLKSFYSRYICYTQTSPAQCLLYYCSHSGIFSSPQNSLTIYPGGVTYQAVVEGFGNNFENGAIEHTYTLRSDESAENLMSQFSGDLMPGTTPLNNSYYNGKELKQTVFKKSGSQLTPVEKTEYTYKIDTTKSKDVVGCAVNKRYSYCAGYPNNPSIDMIDAFNAMRYYHQSRWVYIDSVKQTKYNDNGQPVMTSYTKNYYDNPTHMLLTRSETKTSARDIILNQTKYSSDFGTLTGTDNLTQGIKNLNDKYILSAEVEKSLFKKDSLGNNQRLLDSKFMSYKVSSYKPDTIYQVEQSTPVTNFTSAYNQSGAIIKDSRYKSQVNFTQYDALGNIVQQKQANNIVMSYIWDYQKLYPIAGITNSDSASVAYTSFEADGKGNWSFTGTPAVDTTAPTGKKAYTLNGSNNITKSGLNSGAAYIVSYWTKNSAAFSITGTISDYPVAGRTVNGWKYFEHLITGQTSVTMTGSGSIDELRLYPAVAQMTTYTYDPLTGVTGQCDADNRITYYEYDGLGRLSIIRDQDKNILKKICYNYAGQQENCSGLFYNSAISQNFTRNNCGTGTGSSVAYTVAEAVYSSTISQAYADSLAQVDINANGQAYANAHGTCIYSNIVKSGSFTKNNCGSDSTGNAVTYTVAAGSYTSQNGQAFVDSLAQADVNANGQAYANSHGTCTVNCNSSNCNGQNKKCINNVCRTGTKVYTSSVYDSLLHKYVCTYHYEWIDGSWSGNYTELSETPCMTGGE